MILIQLPRSKSIGARYLVATYFAGTLPADPLFEENDDLMLLQQALLEIYSDEEPIDFGDSPINVGASGTALRFVTSVCASCEGADYVVTGTPRLMQRPMLPLIEILKDAGAVIDILGENGTGPYRVKGNKLEGGVFSIRSDISSQFISALMLVSPSWSKGMNLTFQNLPVSRPYIEMTASLMSKFGIKVNLTDNQVEVYPGKYIEPNKFTVESDWSSAAFFYEACAFGAEEILLENLISPDNSLQGDAIAANLFEKLGVSSSFDKKGTLLKRDCEFSHRIEVDFKNCPDLMLPIALACLGRGIHFNFTNISHLRLKESDRINSLQQEAKKLGFVVDSGDNFVEWSGKTIEREKDILIDPHDDHRVAMSFAMTALYLGEIRIKNPEVVEKSFVDFWNQLQNLGLSCKESNNIMIVSK